MKRLCEYNEKIARYDKKRKQVSDKLVALSAQLQEKNLENARTKQQDFIRKRLLRVKKPVKPLLPNADPNYVPTTIGDCLSNPDLAALILVHLGPIELYHMTRVCSALVDITKRAFLTFAPQQFDRFSRDHVMIDDDQEELENNKRDVMRMRESIVAIVADQRQEIPSTSVSIGALLSLWYHVFVSYRVYLSTHGDYEWHRQPGYCDKTFHHTHLSFIYDVKSGHCESLRNARIFNMSMGYVDALAKFDRRWKKKDRPCQVHETEKIRYFRESELELVKFKPVHGNFYATKAFVYVDPHTMQLRRLRERKEHRPLMMVSFNLHDPVETEPLFDFCELNRLFAWRTELPKAPPFKVPYADESIHAHFHAIGYGSLLPSNDK